MLLIIYTYFHSVKIAYVAYRWRGTYTRTLCAWWL